MADRLRPAIDAVVWIGCERWLDVLACMSGSSPTDPCKNHHINDCFIENKLIRLKRNCKLVRFYSFYFIFWCPYHRIIAPPNIYNVCTNFCHLSYDNEEFSFGAALLFISWHIIIIIIIKSYIIFFFKETLTLLK